MYLINKTQIITIKQSETAQSLPTSCQLKHQMVDGTAKSNVRVTVLGWRRMAVHTII